MSASVRLALAVGAVPIGGVVERGRRGPWLSWLPGSPATIFPQAHIEPTSPTPSHSNGLRYLLPYRNRAQRCWQKDCAVTVLLLYYDILATAPCLGVSAFPSRRGIAGLLDIEIRAEIQWNHSSTLHRKSSHLQITSRTDQVGMVTGRRTNKTLWP